MEHVGTDVRITVRAAYPEFFLYELTREVKWLVEVFWEGLRCDVMVPCIEPCGRERPGHGLFEVQKLIESKKNGRPEYPCDVSGCGEWQDINTLLLNSPATRRTPDVMVLVEEFSELQERLDGLRDQLISLDQNELLRFQVLNENDRRTE